MVTATPPLASGIQPPALSLGGAPDEPAEPAPIPAQATSLVLSDERKDWLVQRALTRISEVMEEMGREQDGKVKPDSWMAERKRNQESYEKNLKWREEPGTIFADGGNLTFGDSGQKARLLSARVRDDLMGTRPFFGCMTTRNGNPKLTKQVEEYMQDRIDVSSVPEAIREGIRIALVRNEAVIKTTYLVDVTPFMGEAKGVFVDDAGRPVMTGPGDYIYENDDVLPDPTTAGLFRLKKDPAFAFQQGQYAIADFDSLPQKLTHYEGADSTVVEYRDFLCPLKVADIHRADINVHLYEKTIDELRGVYGDLETANLYFEHRGSITGAGQPIDIRGEKEEATSRLIEKITVAEVYIRCDADEDGREEEVMLVLDLTNRQAIFYDYLGNHMSRRPFAVIPGVERVGGRWYGIGVFSKMAHQEMYADAQLNRCNQKDSRNASVTFMYKDAILEVKNGEPLVFGTDRVYTINPTHDPAKPPVFRTNLLEKADLGLELMEKMRQSANSEFGVVTASEASRSDMNQSKTATGIMDIQKDADVISRDMEQDIIRGVTAVLDQAVEMEFEHMDPQVVAFSKDGSELVTLNRAEVRSLERQVRLYLTKSRSSAMMATNTQAESQWLRYMQMNPVEQYYGRPFFINMLKALEVDDADDRLPEVTLQEMQAWQKAQAQQKPPEKPVSQSVAVKLPDLAPSERAQELLRIGIQPASPAELAAKQQADIVKKNLEKTPTNGTRPTEPNEQSEPPLAGGGAVAA